MGKTKKLQCILMGNDALNTTLGNWEIYVLCRGFLGLFVIILRRTKLIETNTKGRIIHKNILRNNSNAQEKF